MAEDKKISHLEGTKLREIKAFIEANFNDPAKIDAYSREFKKWYYYRLLFMQVYECSIHKYIVKVRLEEAKRLLKETDEPIKSISEKVGMGTKQAFMNFFKKQAGMNPGTFRKSIHIKHIEKKPEDVFTVSQLDDWALRNGYKK